MGDRNFGPRNFRPTLRMRLWTWGWGRKAWAEKSLGRNSCNSSIPINTLCWFKVTNNKNLSRYKIIIMYFPWKGLRIFVLAYFLRLVEMEEIIFLIDTAATGTCFLGFINKIPIYFEINSTQSSKWGCAKIFIRLINPEQINNSCGKIHPCSPSN